MSFRISNAYRGDDSSDCNFFDGLLKKVTSNNVIHERYFYLHNHLLLQKHTKDSPSSDTKEALQLNIITSISSNKTEIKIQLEDESAVIYTAPSESNAVLWVQNINERLAWLAKQNLLVAKSGYLLKKSGNRLVTSMQERFFRIDTTTLKYYKSKNDKLSDSLGSIDLLTCMYIRPYDQSIACKTFEIKDCESRVYVMQACDHHEMSLWLTALDMVRIRAKEEVHQEELLKVKLLTPLRIRIFDDEGVKAYVTHINKEIDEIYTARMDELDALSLSEHLSLSYKLQNYLIDSIEELNLLDTKHKSKFAIQQKLMEEVNVAYSYKLAIAVQQDSMQMKEASPAEVHKVIIFLTTYHKRLQNIFLPQQYVSSCTHHCGLLDSLPSICERYLTGSHDGKGGVLSHLVDHCVKVWENLVKNPSDSLQRHQDGSFYTFVPTDLWEALNQHLTLATDTQSPVLHVMVANKIVHALNSLVHIIQDYVHSEQYNKSDGIKDIQLEFLSALANDNAAHIEEIVELVEKFDMDEVRGKIDDMYDSVTMNLISCGQTCLKKLAAILMQDVQEVLDKVMTLEWLEEGGQAQVASATISDYLNDLDEYLMPFWSKKFNYFLLESVIITYTKCLLRERPNERSAVNDIEPPSVPVIDDSQCTDTTANLTTKMSSFFTGFTAKVRNIALKQQEIIMHMTTEAMHMTTEAMGNTVSSSDDDSYIAIDAETLGRIAQDVNALNAFFTKHAGPKETELFLSLIGEIQQMLILPIDRLIKHSLMRINELPSSAEAIYYVTIRCIAMRNDCDKCEVDEYVEILKPALQQASLLARQYEIDGVGESQLGLLYLDIMPHDSTTGNRERRGSSSQNGNKVSHRLRDLANIPLASIANKLMHLVDKTKGISSTIDDANDSSTHDVEIDNNIDDDDIYTMDRDAGILVDTVMKIMDNTDSTNLSQAQALYEEKLFLGQERQKNLLSFESHLDKKSSASNLWQKRFFRISTRTNIHIKSDGTESVEYDHKFLWCKKRGGAVINDIDAKSIRKILVVKSHRPLVYCYDRGELILELEANETETTIPVFQYKQLLMEEEDMHKPASALSAMKSNLTHLVTDLKGNLVDSSDKSHSHYYFNLILDEGKDYQLRSTNVDKMINWINFLARACGVAYNESTKLWDWDGKIALDAFNINKIKASLHDGYSSNEATPSAAHVEAPVQRVVRRRAANSVVGNIDCNNNRNIITDSTAKALAADDEYDSD